MKRLNCCIFLFTLLASIFFAEPIVAQDTTRVAKDSLNLAQKILPVGDIKEANALLTGGDLTNASFPGSWPMFGTDARMKIGGYFKADFIGDLNGTNDRTQFLMSTIPVKGSPEYGNHGYIHFMSQETRFNIDVRRIKVGALPLKVFVEGDFFSAGTQFRLRHAYVVAGNFIIGQTWTTLSFLESLNYMIDFAAGDALFGGRTTQIRYQKSVTDNLKLAVGIENLPYIGIENPQNLPGKATLQAPLIAFRADYSWKTGLLLMGTSVAQLHWDGGDAGPSDHAMQVDAVIAGRQYIKKDYVTWNISWGNGSGENIMAFAGTKANAVLNADGKLETMPAFAFVGGYVHKWNDQVSSNFSYAYGWLDPPASREPYSLKRGGVAHANVIWHPVKQLSGGVEYMWGGQRTSNDAVGYASRIQAMVKFDF